MSMKKSDKNCSGAKGSLAFFSSFFGLQVPVSQNRRKHFLLKEIDSTFFDAEVKTPQFQCFFFILQVIWNVYVDSG